MIRDDHAWLIEQVQPVVDQLGLTLLDSDRSFPSTSFAIKGRRFEVLVGVRGSDTNRWALRTGRQVVLWKVDAHEVSMKRPYPAKSGVGWREATVEIIKQAIADGFALQEECDAYAE